MTEPRFLKLTDVSEILNITDSQTYALLRSGELKAIQVGGRKQWRIERVKLEEFIEEAYRRTAANVADLSASCGDQVTSSVRITQSSDSVDDATRSPPQKSERQP